MMWYVFNAPLPRLAVKWQIDLISRPALQAKGDKLHYLADAGHGQVMGVRSRRRTQKGWRSAPASRHTSVLSLKLEG